LKVCATCRFGIAETTSPQTGLGPGVDPWAYLPFINGPRNCLGQHFSLLEARLVLGLLVQRYCFTPADGQVGSCLCMLQHFGSVLQCVAVTVAMWCSQHLCFSAGRLVCRVTPADGQLVLCVRVLGRAASAGALAPEPPRTTRNQPESRGARRRRALARRRRAPTGSDQSKGVRRPRGVS